MSLKIITIGRPSVGKSSVLNTLAGDKLFETGKKEGSINQTYQKKSKDDIFYLDTPGFLISDDNTAKKICDKLQEGGKYKVLFLVTEKNGRIKQQDIEVIAKILKAAPDIGSNYGIIVNKIKKNILKLLQSEPEKKRKFIDQIIGGIPDGKKCSEKNITFFGEYDELKGRVFHF